MKFSLYKASDYENFGTIEVNSLDELKQLNSKYNSKEGWAWTDSHSIIIDFNLTKEEEEQGVEGRITIYDYYME